MSNLVVVDTDVLIDTGRGVSEAIVCPQQIEQQASLAVSVITQMELMIGCRNKAEFRVVEEGVPPEKPSSAASDFMYTVEPCRVVQEGQTPA